MTDQPEVQAALDEAGSAARHLVSVLNQLADNPTPDERRGLLAQWATLVGQLDEARMRVDRPGAS